MSNSFTATKQRASLEVIKCQHCNARERSRSRQNLLLSSALTEGRDRAQKQIWSFMLVAFPRSRLQSQAIPRPVLECHAQRRAYHSVVPSVFFPLQTTFEAQWPGMTTPAPLKGSENPVGGKELKSWCTHCSGPYTIGIGTELLEFSPVKSA